MQKECTIISQALSGTELHAVFSEVDKAQAAALLSHNASGDLNNPLIRLTAEELEKRGIATLRYNYHFVNSIGSEAATWEDMVWDTKAAYAKLTELFPNKKYYVLGKSLGTLSSLFLAAQYPQQIVGVGLYSVPKSMIEKYIDANTLNQVNQRVAIAHGEQDRFGTPDEIKSFMEQYISNLTVQPIPNADHSFERVFSEEELKKVIIQLLDTLIIR